MPGNECIAAAVASCWKNLRATWPAEITAASIAMTTTLQRVAISVLRVPFTMLVSS
jgi:hypothetical protein